jgi:four helix bundle protein
MRAGMSPGAQYRECVHSRSKAESISKMSSALQELAEAIYWLEILIDSKMVKASRMGSLQKEAGELTAILMTCLRNLKARRRK